MDAVRKLALVVILLGIWRSALAITNTAIAVSGTNIVLSWPSYGYESYLIQYRKTLDPTDSWSQLANAYLANSTNRTKFTIYGVVPPSGGSGSGGSGGGTNPPPPSPSQMNNATLDTSTTTDASSSQPMVMPANGTGSAVPLALYPSGFDLSGFVIFDPTTGQSISGDGYTVSPSTTTSSTSGATPLNDSSSDPVTTGFYRVFHIPDWLADVSNYTFDGPTFIPVDFASPDAPVDYVDETTVLINGEPTDEAVFTPYVSGGVTNWGMGIYFDRLPNGTNTIQLLTTVRQSDQLSDQTPYITFSNAPQTITVSNSVSYTNWADLILSNTYTFNAQSSTTNVDWEIDIYDVYGSFVNSQTGHSDGGNISWEWNLTDANGYSRNDDNDPFFYAYISLNSGPLKPLPSVAKQFPDKGAWLFAYMDKMYDDGTTNYPTADGYYTNAIHLMEGGPEEWGYSAYDYPIKYGRSYTQAQRDASWATLKANYLQSWSIRNFYYYGHGAAHVVGGDMNTLNSSNYITGATNLPGSKAYLTGDWVLGNVTINKSYGMIPFRFVFMDGCNTAVDDWCYNWGVPKQVETVDYYRSAANKIHVRPNAFVGWDVTIGGSKDWGQIDKFWAFRQDWMAEWAGTFQEQLSDSLSTANQVSGWVDAAHFSHLKEYGYTAMMFQQYNRSGDWP
jgi:hypothetical protein